MKTFLFAMVLTSFSLLSCNDSGKDTVEKADSVNKENIEKAPASAVDEESASFLVRIADAGMAEVEVTNIAAQKAYYKPVKEFAGYLNKEHKGINGQIKKIAATKQVVLPEEMSDEKKMEITDLQKKEGKDFDKAFLAMMVTKHEGSIDLFNKAIVDAKDPDVKVFAAKIVSQLQVHLDSAKALQTKY